MPKGKDREFTVGDFWLAKKPGRDGPDGNWCRCWYDSDARQTRYHSLGTADFPTAKPRSRNGSSGNSGPAEPSPPKSS